MVEAICSYKQKLHELNGFLLPSVLFIRRNPCLNIEENKLYTVQTFPSRFIKRTCNPFWIAHKTLIETFEQLTHKNIAKYKTIIHTGPTINFFNELILGETLAGYFENKMFFSIEDSLFILKALVEAMCYVNSKGLNHGELNPIKIFIIMREL